MNVDPDKCGIKANRIAKTISGGVKILIEEKTPGAKQELIKQIQENVASADLVREPNKFKSIVLMDLELDTEKEEVKDALIRDTGVAKEDIKLNDFRENKYGKKMVTVSMPREYADKVIRIRYIKIGWTQCIAKERIDPIFCGRCQTYGHSIRDCKAKERVGTRCMRCGQIGHMARDCKSTPACFACKVEGHSGNSMSCPKYREMVEEIKKQRNGL